MCGNREGERTTRENPLLEIDSLLESRGGKRVWILDDILEVPSEFNTPSPDRHILLLNADIPQPTVALGPLTTLEQGAEVILRRSTHLDFDQTIESASAQLSEPAKAVAAVVGNIPVALVGAGRYLEEHGSTPARLLQYLADKEVGGTILEDIMRGDLF